jgi:hypothetical protein
MVPMRCAYISRPFPAFLAALARRALQAACSFCLNSVDNRLVFWGLVFWGLFFWGLVFWGLVFWGLVLLGAMSVASSLAYRWENDKIMRGDIFFLIFFYENRYFLGPRGPN